MIRKMQRNPIVAAGVAADQVIAGVVHPAGTVVVVVAPATAAVDPAVVIVMSVVEDVPVVAAMVGEIVIHDVTVEMRPPAVIGIIAAAIVVVPSPDPRFRSHQHHRKL
jgi:hypothetical protein